MKSFKVADFKAPLQEVDEATPQPSGTQVLIKVKAAGVCHSDLHIWEGGYDLGHGRKPLSLKDRGINLPLTMGHETVGEILAFGPDVKPTDQGDLKLGDVARGGLRGALQLGIDSQPMTFLAIRLQQQSLEAFAIEGAVHGGSAASR